MLVHQESGSLLLKARDPLKIMNLIPKARQIDFEGHNLAIRFGLDEVKVLNNIGIKAPSPILYNYNWPGRFTALEHQKLTAGMLTVYRRAFVLNETGTMKTASALWAADYLMKQGLVKKCLILSKLSTLEAVWMQEIFNVLMHRTSVVLHDTRERRLAKFALDVDFYIINHEGLELIADELALRTDIDLIILDEASEYRNASTRKYKVLQSVLRLRHRFWPMTATPCPNAPTDAWALARLVSPERVPKFFGQFQKQTMFQAGPYRWIPKTTAYVDAYNALQPAVRYRKADCLDLPPLVTENRTAELSSDQKKAYDAMRTKLVLDQGGTSISAANAADAINKLRQILCGAVRETGSDNYIAIDHKPRLKVLLECIESATAKSIVIVPFKGILKLLEEEISKHHTCAVLNGDVTPKKRNEIITNFKTTDDPKVLLCHPKVMAHGLNLTEADMTIFYAPIYSNDEAMQVIERFNRPGQTRKMTLIRISASKLEDGIYKMLENKQQGQESILDFYMEYVLEKEV
jgi:SNF2 family DNA or RNA helicase